MIYVRGNYLNSMFILPIINYCSCACAWGKVYTGASVSRKEESSQSLKRTRGVNVNPSRNTVVKIDDLGVQVFPRGIAFLKRTETRVPRINKGDTKGYFLVRD